MSRDGTSPDPCNACTLTGVEIFDRVVSIRKGFAMSARSEDEEISRDRSTLGAFLDALLSEDLQGCHATAIRSVLRAVRMY